MPQASTIREIAPPAELLIAASLPGAHFHDSYVIPYPVGEQSALAICLQVIGASPPWVDRLMRLRNQLVQLVGLKDLGDLNDFGDLASRPLDSYREGQRVGIFTLLRLTPNEVILGDSDRHLDVQVSFATANGSSLINTTVVHTHNRLGRYYMWLVKPFHRRIVRSLLKRALRAERGPLY